MGTKLLFVRTLSVLSLLVLGNLSLTACSGEKNYRAEVISKEPAVRAELKIDRPDTKKNNPIPDGDDTALPPVSVSGAFLTCQFKADLYGANCMLEDRNKKVITGITTESGLSVALSNEQGFSPPHSYQFFEKSNPISFEIDFSVQTQTTYLVTVTDSDANTVKAELDAENLKTIINAMAPLPQDETTVLKNLIPNGSFEEFDQNSGSDGLYYPDSKKGELPGWSARWIDSECPKDPVFEVVSTEMKGIFYQGETQHHEDKFLELASLCREESSKDLDASLSISPEIDADQWEPTNFYMLTFLTTRRQYGEINNYQPVETKISVTYNDLLIIDKELAGEVWNKRCFILRVGADEPKLSFAEVGDDVRGGSLLDNVTLNPLGPEFVDNLKDIDTDNCILIL
jgi:hypothetical protein